MINQIIDKSTGRTEKILRIPLFARTDKDLEKAGKKKLCKEGESDWDKDIRNMPSMERLVSEKKVIFVI